MAFVPVACTPIMSQIQTILLELVDHNTHYTHYTATRVCEAHTHNVEVLPEFEVLPFQQEIGFYR